MRKILRVIAAVFLTSAAIAPFDASASPVMDGPGVSLIVELPDGPLCGKDVPVTIRVENALREVIEIGSLTTSRHRFREEKNEHNGETMLVSEDLPATVLGEPKSAEVEKKMTIDASFPIPSEDGVFSDTFTLKWRRTGAGAWIYTDAFVKTEVTDGCAEIISDLEYEALMQVYSLIPFVRDGKEVLELAVEGAGTFDGYEVPWTEIDDGFAPISTASEDAVVIDGTPYQFIDPSYETVSDDAVSDAEGEGMALDSILSLSYCVRVRYHQDAYQAPTPTATGMRWWRPRTRITNSSFEKMNFQGLVVELWDRNEGVRDHYITSAILNYTANGQYFCIDFDWDQTAHGETYPDPFIRTVYKVAKPAIGPSLIKYGILCRDSYDPCLNPIPMSWRDQYTANLGSTGTTAYVSTYFTSVSDPPDASYLETTPSSQATQMAYFQKFFQVWNGYELDDSIRVAWGDMCSPGGGSDDHITLCRKRDAFGEYPEAFWHRRWDVPPHEMGHSYRSIVWGIDPSVNCGSGAHRGYCSYTYECATSEGWASFVAMRTWYPDDTDISEPILYTQQDWYEIEPGGYTLPHSPFDDDYCNMDDAGTNACPFAYPGQPEWHQCYAKNEIMGVRAFWDMLDSNPDGDDLSSDSVLWPYLVDVWVLYPDGDGNHELTEEDSNMVDYLYNAAEISSDVHDDIEAAMENNSMTWQDPT
ncbi:MAG: hypothetical protein M0R80_30415 [Proteobacteria bacterium]|nr:hypothetical protein [Pseudomonadota bacterium]